MKQKSIAMLSAAVLSLALSGNASAKSLKWDDHSFDPDITLEMCERLPKAEWKQVKWERFEVIFERKREDYTLYFPERVKIRWEEKWGDREDWSRFDRSRRPFKDFHMKHHFHADPSPIPVPAAVWLFGSGLLGLVAVARRKG